MLGRSRCTGRTTARSRRSTRRRCALPARMDEANFTALVRSARERLPLDERAAARELSLSLSLRRALFAGGWSREREESSLVPVCWLFCGFSFTSAFSFLAKGGPAAGASSRPQAFERNKLRGGEEIFARANEPRVRDRERVTTRAKSARRFAAASKCTRRCVPRVTR